MNIIDWFLRLAIICTILVHQVTAPFSGNDDANKAEDIASSTNIQVEREPPLAMIVYDDDNNSIKTIYTDLTEAKKMDLKSLFDKREPKYIVLFCENELDPKFIENGYRYYQFFTAKTIIEEIDSKMEYPTCESITKRSMKIDTDTFHDIFFQLSVAEDQLNNEEDHLYIKVKKDFEITSTRAFQITNNIFIMRIWFSVEYMIPTAIEHFITAHMHFDDYDIKCKNMDLEKIEFKIRETPVDIKATLSSAPDGFQWRQLVPMQDFKGIYTTNATCTYLNYVLLHNNVIENLQKVERFIRTIADNLYEVAVTSGTYETIDNSNPNSSDRIVHPIPKILWKTISFWDSDKNVYSFLIVIHNQETPRICARENSTQGLGWDSEDGAIGTVYNCFIEESIVNKLNLHEHLIEEAGKIIPLYLLNERVKKLWKNFIMDVRNGTKQASSTNIQVKREPPLAMIVYNNGNYSVKTFYTDLTEAKKMDLKSLFDKRKPKYIVLLCENKPDPKKIQSGSHYYQFFTVETIITEIDQNMEYPTCESNTKRSMMIDTGSFYDIYFQPSVTKDQFSNPVNLYTSFIRDFRIGNTLNIAKEIFLIRIWFSVEYMIPTQIEHTVTAHMHFDDYDIKCENMNLLEVEFKRRETPVDIKATLSSAPDGFQWRQLVPIQDFKGIYTTNATCTYLNYVLVHNNVIESLQKVERFIRKIADNSFKVSIASGTYETVDNSNPNSSDRIVHPIPKILWKKITLGFWGSNEYSSVIVIHNQETPRVYAQEESTQELGWDDEDESIGIMYVCFIEESIVNKLNIHMYSHPLADIKKIKPLHLFSDPVKELWKNLIMDVRNGTKEKVPSFTPSESSKLKDLVKQGDKHYLPIQ